MKGIRVDPVRRTARAEGGVKWGEFDHETQAFGLATPGGIDADTGIAGLTLGGGIGWLKRKYGLACDNLISADIVTADGELRHASAREHPDLFWGCGAGAAISAWSPPLSTSSIPWGLGAGGRGVLPLCEGQRVPAVLPATSPGRAPMQLNTIGGLGTSPDGAKVGVMAVCYSGPLEEGEQVLRPVREFGPPLADHIQPMPYTAAQKILAPLAPAGRHYYIKSHFIQDISAGAIDTMVAHFEQVTSPLSAMIFQQLGNAVSRVPSRDTAFGHRDTGYEWAALSAWLDPGESVGHIRWTRAFSQACCPSPGFYVNQVGTEADEGADLIREAFGANYQRLADLKRQYDPTNLFRHNQNITPTV